MTNETCKARYHIDDVSVFCAFDEIVDISKLKENPQNPNTHPKEQIKLLSEIIKRTGWRAPITVSTLSGFIVKGHGRLQAAHAAGLKQCPVEYQNFQDEAEEMAALLADNKLAELAEIDTEKLTEIFKDYKFEDLSLTGYSQDEFDELVEVFEEAQLLGDPDDVPEEVETRCKLGDVWQLGKHRLMCGDSTSVTDVEKLMNGEKADITFTSPPYNAGHTVTEYVMNKKSKYANDDDNKTTDEYSDFLKKFTLISLKFSEYSFVNLQSLTNNKVALIDYLYNLKDFYADTIIWDKLNGQPAMAHNVLNSVFEYVHVFSRRANRVIGVKDFRGTLDNIIHISKQNKNEFSKIHNATFPLEFANYFVNNFSLNSVLELFCGVGTTLIVCEQLNRKCYAMELDPHYCDVIITRWETFTGQKAVILNKKNI